MESPVFSPGENVNIWPLLGVVVLVLACSFVGNGLEAAFDPREKDYGF